MKNKKVFLAISLIIFFAAAVILLTHKNTTGEFIIDPWESQAPALKIKLTPGYKMHRVFGIDKQAYWFSKDPQAATGLDSESGIKIYQGFNPQIPSTYAGEVYDTSSNATLAWESTEGQLKIKEIIRKGLFNIKGENGMEMVLHIVIRAEGDEYDFLEQAADNIEVIR